MAKTTFLGYVPSLKSKHEATIVGHKAIQSKGGSIRYTLQGEYDGRKTLPKTVSKADFESVYGFDAKEAEAVIIQGKKGKEDAVQLHIVGIDDKTDFTPEKIVPIKTMNEYGHKKLEKEIDGLDATKSNHAETVGNPSPASVEPPAPSEKPFPQEPSNENFSAEEKSMECPHCNEEIWNIDVKATCELCGGTLEEWIDYPSLVVGETEVKEAFGFGKDEEEEESDEPKTQEFTVVLQEGDKLELTDIPDETEEEEEEESAAPDEPKEEDSPEESENEEKVEEKAAENVRVFVVSSVDYETDGEELDLPQDFTFALDIDDIGDTTDMQEIADEIVDDISDETGFLVSGFYFQEKMPDGTLVDLDAETYEAVQAKVTRPVKEDETEDEEEESEEGLSTGAKVALGVGALAVGAAIFGAEGEEGICDECGEEDSLYEFSEGKICKFCLNKDYTMGAEGEYPEEFLEEFYSFDSNPTADTQDEETIAIAYAAWLESKKEEDEEARMLDETHSDIRDDYIPYASETDYSRIYEATSGDGYINHDRIDTEEQRMVELRYDDPTTYYNWNSPYDVDESEVDDAVRDELGDEPGEGFYGATVEVRGSKYGEQGQKYVDVDVDMDTDYGDSRTMGLAAEHESESDGYAYAYTKGHEDGIGDEVIYRPRITTDKGRNIYKKILRQKAEDFSADTYIDLSPFKQRIANGASAKNVIENYRIHGKEDRKELMDYERRLYETETVGSPSPSGPSSTPEPAEATGSEPSNENMEAEGSNMKLALGILGVGVGAVALLGGDRIKKIFEKLGL